MESSLDLILITSYTNIAPLDMVEGDKSGTIGDISPLNFFAKQRITNLSPFVYAPSTSASFILQKRFEIASSIDCVLVYSNITYKNAALDIILEISGQITSVDILLAKLISTDIALDMYIATRGTKVSNLDVVLGIRKYKKANVDILLRKTKVIANNLDILLKLSAVAASIDIIATPELIGERDIHEFTTSIHIEEVTNAVVSSSLEKEGSITTVFDSANVIGASLSIGTEI